MTSNHKSFARKWSQKFLRHGGTNKSPKLSTAQEWCAKLAKESANCNWMRLIISSWHGQTFENSDSVDPLITWLENTCVHPAFVKSRGANHLNIGVQIWFSHLEDVAAFRVCISDEVLQSRFMSHEEAVDNWLNNWSSPNQHLMQP